jgi:hypothetical protein
MRHTLVALLLLTGCAQHFTRVDFKYDSNAHLHPVDTIIPFAGTPDEAMKRVASFVSERHGVVTNRGVDRPAIRIWFPPDADKIWAAHRAIFEQEWRCFDKDDPRTYFAIDRSAPLVRRDLVVVQQDAVVASMSMRVELPARMAQWKTQPGLSLLSPIWWTQTSDVSIKPVLYVFAWTDSNGKTWVYARGTPQLNGIEAGAPQAWVAHDLWKASTGYQEAILVSELLASLK